MGKILGMQERGQFDALSQVLEIYDESRGTGGTLDHSPNSVPLNIGFFDIIRYSGRKRFP